MNYEIIYYTGLFIQMIVGYNLVLPLFLVFVYKLLSEHRTSVPPESSGETDYAIIVTAYEQTAQLGDVVRSIGLLNYSNYLVYIVADGCDVSSLNFDNDKIIILRPPQVLASNIRSHFYAIERFQRDHERLTIIDSDNLIHPEYLNELNRHFNQGFAAVQGLRKPKNLNTSHACLDAARDIYYHYYDARILFGLGSSATLSGSGMAFSTSLFKECLETKEISGAGFDKVLQYEIVKKNQRIAFAPSAIVFDEKTAESSQLVKQRSRWINTWFKYWGFGLKILSQGFKNLSLNQLLFGLILLRPPLFITLILSVVFTLLSFILNPTHAIGYYWILAELCFVIGFAIALIDSRTSRKIYVSLLNIPIFIFYQITALFRSGKTNGKELTTTHSHQADIKDLLQQDVIKTRFYN